jgi:phosphate transport system permease protein
MTSEPENSAPSSPAAVSDTGLTAVGAAAVVEPPRSGGRGRGVGVSHDLTRRNGNVGEAVFRNASRAAGVFVVALMSAIAVFLVIKAWSAIQHDTVNFLFSTAQWDVADSPVTFGLLPVFYGTVISSLLALLMAAPVAIGVALFITQYAPRRLAQLLGYIVDLLAAVPSVVYGLWGVLVLSPHIGGVSRFINTILGWIPLFASDGTFGGSMFTASVVLAIMILPIIAALSREVFLQTPREHVEAAYALGSTRWEMIKLAVLPYGKSGVVSAIVLGFGRALGETMAVALVLSSGFKIVVHLLDADGGGNTIAANIATLFADAQGDMGRGALIASGLLLFLLTLLVNYLARALVRGRGRDRRVSIAPVSAATQAAATPLTSGVELSAQADAPPPATESRGAPDSRAARRIAESSAREHTGAARRLRNRVWGGLVSLSFVVAVAPLVAIMYIVVKNGTHRLDSTFLSHSMRNVNESDPGGGAYHAIIGTLEQVGLAALIAIPIGVLVAIYLVEYGGAGRFRMIVTFIVDVMTGLPSIVAGLFVLAFWVLALQIDLYGAGFAGSLALMILMLPLVIRGSEEMLKLVSHDLREASYALGVPKWRTILRVVLPTAFPGIVTSVMLAIARVMGETAPVLLLVGAATSINMNPFSGQQNSLGLYIYNEYTLSQGAQTAIDRAWAAALLLVIIVMLLNLLARLLAWWKSPAKSR